jgi:flavin reductase (DIM6/NTAB) family NADH-FMN oxidoreductase RutF
MQSDPTAASIANAHQASPVLMPRADDTRPLRNAFGRFTTGVTIVTTQTPVGPLGITANSFSSVSLDPPLVMWSIGRHSSRFAAFAECQYFAVHVLAIEQHDLCRRFARSGCDFSGLELTFNDEGAPLLPGALARFECETADRFTGGDHEMLLGRVLRMTAREGEPMVFSAGRYRRFAPDA